MAGGRGEGWRRSHYCQIVCHRHGEQSRSSHYHRKGVSPDEKAAAILIVAKDFFTAITAIHYVVNGTRIGTAGTVTNLDTPKKIFR
jgi:hypothetical protein